MSENFARNLRDLSGDIRLQSTAGTPDATHCRTLARGARRHGEAQLAPEATASATEAVFGHRGDWGFYTMMWRRSCPPSRARGWNRCGRSALIGRRAAATRVFGPSTLSRPAVGNLRDLSGDHTGGTEGTRAGAKASCKTPGPRTQTTGGVSATAAPRTPRRSRRARIPFCKTPDNRAPAFYSSSADDEVQALSPAASEPCGR